MTQWRVEPWARALAIALLNRARLDVDLPTLCEDCNRPVRECALRFLTGATEEDEEALQVWCRLAGIRPETVKRWVKEKKRWVKEKGRNEGLEERERAVA